MSAQIKTFFFYLDLKEEEKKLYFDTTYSMYHPSQQCSGSNNDSVSLVVGYHI